MPLVRIEVSDFKSYRGRQTIGPFRNFTSVIGPNGAGKSNLMDAISFVLGVKSAQLRSSQLKDLVYRGRRLAREPAEGSEAVDDDEDDDEGEGEGTAKKAWVLAVYEDQDKKEWHFQRTISTTGASEYKLNGKVVTYTTYNAALVKHNILVKAKNFLVFQGDVEAVASQSPKELTRLIEQISGSLELAAEYEKAKEAQERATENATHNFSKRRGITSEIKQYREQKGEADRFEQLCHERDQLILRRVLFKLYHIEEALEKNSREIKEQNRALAPLREEQQATDEALQNARAEQAKARSNVMQKEKRIKKADKALEAKKPELIAVDTQIAHASKKIKNSSSIKEQVVKDAEKQEEKLRAFRRDLENVQREAAAALEAQRQASQNNLSLSEESLEEYRRLKAQANVLAVEERQALETLNREEKTASRVYTQLKDKQEEFERRKATLTEELSGSSEKKTELEEKVASLQADLDKVKQELVNQQSDRTRISLLEAEISEKLQDVHNKLLQAGVDQKETERDAKFKETLSNLQRIFPGVRGRMIDLCKPTQRKYETAISVVFGRNVDAIVVDEEKTAIDCIEYMRNQRAGQATFIPLDTIQVKPINDKFRAFAKGARLALDVVQYETAVERAIQHACGNALVCDTMDVARYVCYEKGQEVKAVTLEGTIIHKSGLITGGRSSHDNNKKWEEKDVQGLHRVRATLLAQMSDLTKTKPLTRADEDLISEIARLESSLNIAKDDLSASKLRVNGLKDELKHVERTLKENKPQLSKAEKVLNKIRESIQGLASVVHDAEDGIFGDFCQRIGVQNIREYEERQLKVAQEESDSRLRFDTQIAQDSFRSQFEEQQLKAIRERLAVLDSTVTAEEANLRRLAETKTRTQAELDEMEEGIKVLQEELKELNEVLEERNKEVDRVKKTALKASKVLDQALKEISLKNDEIEKLGLERSSLYRKCRLEEIELPMIEGSLKDVPMEENLREEVAMDVGQDENATQRPKMVPDFDIEVDFSELDDDEREDTEGETLAEYEASLKKLHEDIERMAPNLKAIDRLDDVEAKLAETEKEADKARKDSKNARDAFNDVKKRRTDLFINAYNHISERIDQVYKDLTKGKAAPMGGVAYLSLEDNEACPFNFNCYTTKQFANKFIKGTRHGTTVWWRENSRSVGTLIRHSQPSPFFVLDEVDAALDNTNVAKVANYIRSQASDTFQFVVISLKGSLYERGHSLVGIYRDQDVNSSRTLTLDLTQYDE
ncbi:hypothetical protein EWM64_g4174 [Hericium alpestre]|uniref:Structural maintenance of chromosomes protein n=1 Tax=Hericium alpestre TaxID=135208 RepID=A0A4Z0A084_9AGAM|nr:hypothetical protein EWM64_g4174 [Hericium alpestre]